MMFCVLERGTGGAAWIPVSLEYCYFSNTQRSFLCFKLFPEGNNTWKFPHFISLSTKKLLASRMSRNQLWGGWQLAPFPMCDQQQAFGGARLRAPKMFLSSIHTHGLFCPQAKDRWMTPPFLPNRLSWRRSTPVWLKSTSWGCWRGKSAWKLQHNSKTWPNTSPRTLLTWKPSAPAMYVSARCVRKSTGHGHAEKQENKFYGASC